MRSKKAFTLASSVALAGGVITGFSPDAEAACPEPAKATYPIVKPNAQKNACTAADIKAMEDSVATAKSLKDIQDATAKSSAGCAACIFTKEGDPTWGPVVLSTADPTKGFVNFGLCLAYSMGGSIACQEASDTVDECIADVCSLKNCGDATKQDACVDKVLADKTSCGKIDFITACGGQANVQKLFTQCDTGKTLASLTAALKLTAQSGCMAGMPQTDGGTDGGSSSGSTSSSSSSSSSSGASGSTSSSGSSGKSSTSSSGATPDDTGTTSSSSSGCATTGANDNGSLVAALAMVGAGIIGVSRRRKKNEKRAD